jgi:hypothetical protein
VEYGGIGPQSFTLRTMAARVGDTGELWSNMLGCGWSLHEPMEQLRRLRGTQT